KVPIMLSNEIIMDESRQQNVKLLLRGPLVSSLGPDLEINLTHEPTFLEFLRNPSELEQRLAACGKRGSVFIDEVQRLPNLLNTVQFLLDQPGNSFKFYLTGSSARKLRRGQANLLPGRIHSYSLGPLSCGELGYALDLRKALSFGTLPGIWVEEDDATRQKTLRSYAATYLKEEVQAENLTRNLEGFARFLSIAAAWAGQYLDLAKIAAAAYIARQTAVRYFEVLEDCLLVRRVDAFAKSLTRRLVQHPKYFFFDVGVLNGLLGNFEVSADRIGRLFEHFVCNLILNEASARDIDLRISTYRTEHGAEVDLIVEIGSQLFALEVKSSRSAAQADCRGLQSFREYYGRKQCGWIFYQGTSRKQLGDVEVLPWQEGIREIFLRTR
ncbi:MAG: ATP-binding protein, partial [Acidobacteria bacterium]|nr:ATP-binding protein [Acidobacteriota bacterium]